MTCKPSQLFPGTALLAALLLCAGCATDGAGGRDIGSLHLFTVPVALDLDPPPGPDAIGVTVYASGTTKARGLPITSGRMEIQMYDGALPPGNDTNVVPRRVWTFPAAEMKRLGIKNSLGYGYRFLLRWGGTPPLQDRITIVARYVSVRDRVVQSAPATLAVMTK